MPIFKTIKSCLNCDISSRNNFSFLFGIRVQALEDLHNAGEDFSERVDQVNLDASEVRQ